jgi:hypothetical protein
MAMQTIKGDIFDGICVAPLFSFMCCVFDGICVAPLFSFLCCVFDGICVAPLFRFLCCVVFLCCLCLRPVCPKVQVSLVCPFLIAPSVLSLTFIYREQMHLIKCCISIILLRTNKFGQI